MVALALPAQLGAFMQQPIADTDPTALLLLDIASGMVRDYLQMELDAVAADVVLLEPVNGSNGVSVFLPELPVTAVSLVETFDNTVTPGVWTTADPLTYTISKLLGIIAALPYTGVTWPYLPETWRVTYNHGFVVIPDSLVGVTLGVAARQWNTANGIDLERIGSYQVKYSMEADGFSPIEKKALARYVNPRIA